MFLQPVELQKTGRFFCL